MQWFKVQRKTLLFEPPFNSLCLSPLPLFYFGSILVLSFLEITFIDPLLTVLCRKGLFASLLEKLEIGHYTILKYDFQKMPLVLKVRTEQNFEILKCAKSTNQNFFLRLDIYSRRGIVLTICLTCRNGRNMVLIRSPFYGYCFHRLLNGQFFSLLINWYFYNFA